MHLKIFIFPILYLLTVSTSYSQKIPSSYYAPAISLTGQRFKTALKNIIKGHIIIPYGSESTDSYKVLSQMDRDTVNPDNVILIYSWCSINAAQEYSMEMAGIGSMSGQNRMAILLYIILPGRICIISNQLMDQ
jgi:hypothetical protein